MALSPQLLQFKSSGVYRLEFDKSQTANINVETLRLVVGHSRKGPYNTPVLIDTQETFNNVFGGIDKSLEKKGMFFHRSAIESLTRGPILALNIAAFTDGSNGTVADEANYQALSTTGSVEGNVNKDGSSYYPSFFDNDKFMTPSDTATLTAINAGDNKVLNFVNIKQDSITIIARQAADVAEFDMTAESWYGTGNVPDYLNKKDKMSDFMLDIFVFKGEFDAATMSSDPIYKPYFGNNGEGLRVETLDAFANLREVTLLAQYTGSILPGFKDLEGRNLYIESIVNAEARRTGLFCAVDEDAVLEENGTKVDFVGHVVDADEDFELLSHHVGQVEANATALTVENSHSTTTPGAITVSTTTPEITISDVEYNAIAIDSLVGEFLEADTTGEYAEVTANTAWSETLAATSDLYNQSSANAFTLTANDTAVLSSGNTVLTISGSGKDYTTGINALGDHLFGGTGVANVEFTSAYIAGETVLTAVSGTFDSSVAVTTGGGSFDIFVDDGVVKTYNNGTQSGTAGFQDVLNSSVSQSQSGSDWIVTMNPDLGSAITNLSSLPTNSYVYGGVSQARAKLVSISNSSPAIDEQVTLTFDAEVDSSILSDFGTGTTFDIFSTDGVVISGYNNTPASTFNLDGVDTVVNTGNTLTISGSGTDYTAAIALLGDHLFGGTGAANVEFIATYISGDTVLTAVPGGTFDSSIAGPSFDVFADDGVTPGEPALGEITITFDSVVNSSYNNNVTAPVTTQFLDVSNSRVFDEDFSTNSGTYIANPGSDNFSVEYQTSSAITFPLTVGLYVDSATTDRLAKITRISKVVVEADPLAGISASTTFTVYCDIEPDYADRYIKSFADASSYYKTFVLPKANVVVKTITEYLNSLAGGTGLYDALIDKDIIDFRYVVDTFASHDASGINNKRNLSLLAKDRENAAAILNAPTVADFKLSTNPSFKDENGTFKTQYIETGGNLDQNPTSLYTLPSISEGANYAFYYGPGLIIDDNGKDLIVPPAAYVANNYIDKYTNALPWSIVAGPRRGVVSGANVKGVEYSFDKNDRDILEPFGINPIVFQRGVGLTILGNKTAQQSIKSALSSAHVREVLIYIQDGMADILKDYVFEFNNVQTRLEIKTLADSFMESVKQDGGVFEYRNIMDQTNNTNEVIDNNMGIIDTYVEPVKGLEIVVHRTTILNTGEIQSGNLG